MKNFYTILFVILVTLLIIGLSLYRHAFAPTESSIPNKNISTEQTEENIEIIATELEVPWDIARLPNGDLLVTERTGDLLRISSTSEIVRTEVPRVAPAGEGGLMGVVLHPDFSQNNWIYLYRTIETEAGRDNEVVRFVYNDDHTLTEEMIIITNLRGATYHDGGALSFGPDGLLYIATGDAGIPALAQDVDSLAGKILRVTDTGAVPEDNPFGTPVYSYGHRNPQGLAWDSQNQLWSTEHGRSGVQSGFDELNKIEAGANYGWPDSQGDVVLPGTVGPVVHSGADDTWAPASLAADGDTLYFAGLRGQRLFQGVISEDRDSVSLSAFLTQEYGRLRATRIIDDVLYITTSNRDNRGQVRDGDDMILTVPLSVIQ